LVELMQRDTQKHIAILRFVRKRTSRRPTACRWDSRMEPCSTAGLSPAATRQAHTSCDTAGSPRSRTLHGTDRTESPTFPVADRAANARQRASLLDWGGQRGFS
jgi:hypothetical protein